MRRSKFLLFGVAALVVGLLLGVQLNSAESSDDVTQARKKLEDAFFVIMQRYVEEVDPATLAESAIQGMLGELDPHSIFIDAERMRRVREEFDASFEGIGIQYELIKTPGVGDSLAVLNPLPGGPSEEAGLISGDRIIEVGGTSTIGWTTEDVQTHLKGPRGSTVDIVVKRPGYRNLLYFTITRDKIPLETLDAAYMLDERTGFIKLDRFASTTYSEFIGALRDLKAQGMERLVLDLRNNGGGYMEMAVRISDEFLGGTETIVSQKGRTPDATASYRSRRGGSFTHQPIIVLVDENSASASEIVAGALQDHDRALVLGRRTFGKGLVQRQFGLEDGSAIRVTISRYYTPSGRLIQTPYESGDRRDYYTSKFEQQQRDAALSAEEIMAQVPDSLLYLTANGRTVMGGGGILPDYVIQRDTLSAFMQAILGKSLPNTFVRQWLDENGTEIHAAWDNKRDAFIEDFDVSDRMLRAFLVFARENGIEIGERRRPQTDTDTPIFTDADLAAERPLLKTILKGRLATRLYDRKQWYPIYAPQDRLLQEAMARWNAAEDLALNHVR